MSNRQNQVEKYYKYYSGNGVNIVDAEISNIGIVLYEQAKGKLLDLGCGAVPMAWAIFMKNVEEIYAVDLPKESIKFLNEKIKYTDQISSDFREYKDFLEGYIRDSLPDDYIKTQIKKIKDLNVCDMTKEIPYENDFFDTVCCLFSIGCLESIESVEKACLNIKAKLKEGGTFMFTLTNGRNSNDELPEYYWKGLDISCDDINNIFLKNGFSLLDKKEVIVKEGNLVKYNKIYINIFQKT